MSNSNENETVELPDYEIPTEDSLLLAEGTYTFKVKEAGNPRKNEKSGNISAMLKLVVQDEGEHQGRIQVFNLNFPGTKATAGAIGYFQQCVIALGFAGRTFNYNQQKDELIGVTVRGKVAHHDYEGRIQAQIKGLYPVSSEDLVKALVD